MASDRKANYVFYERKVRDDKEIESLLLGEDENLESDENDEWVVQKSAKKLTSSPNQKSGIPNNSRTSRQSHTVKSPRKAADSAVVSPIKIKRKLSYAVNKVETPPKKRPAIVSPILIKRITDSNKVRVICSPSACHRKPTIELTSSDDDEDAKKAKHKRKNKKRPKSADESSGSDGRAKGIASHPKTSPKKRITYYEGSDDDEFELHKPKPSRTMLPRKSKPLKLKLSGSEDEEIAIKRTPSRKCKVQQNDIEENDFESSIDELMLPLSSKKRVQMLGSQNFMAEGRSDDELKLPLSGKKHVKGKSESTQLANGTGTPLKALPNGTPSETLTNWVPLKTLVSVTPSKVVASGTPSKTVTNGTPQKTPSPGRVYSQRRLANSKTSLAEGSRLSDIGFSRVLSALQAVEAMDLSPRKCSDWSAVDSPKSKAVSSVNHSPSKLGKGLSCSRRHSRRNLDEVFLDESKDTKQDAESHSATANRGSADTPRSQPKREGRSLFKTPSKNSSPGEVGTPGNGRPTRTPTKEETLQSAVALSKADATPEKGFTPGKPVTKSTRSTPAKGTTPSKSTTPAKPSSVVIPVSSSEDEEELASPLRRSYKRAAKSKPCLPPKVETPLKRAVSTPSKTFTPLRRSARVSMSPSTPSLRQKVLLANTPRSSLPPVKDESESEDEFISPRKTPKTAKKKLDLTPSTPASCRKVGHGFLSPVVAEREKRGPSTPSSDLDIARAQLQVSTLPKSLPCREKEFSDIKNFIERKLKDGTGGCMYVSGVPGTGKTATVHTVVRALQKTAEDRELAAFDFVEVNGLRLTEPRQAYVRIWQCLSKNKVTPDQSLKHLETKFSGKPKRSTVLLVDELDYLCNRRQDVIYNILDWTTKRFSKLVVLTIANTMDLPERTLKGKVTSRMGLTRLVFQPYNFHQLEEIVLDRLDGCKAFNPDAVQLVARKVAAVSGDARRALDICRRSTEILELEGQTNVSVLDIQKVLTQIFAGSRVQAIKNCSSMAKFVLRAIKDEVLRTGVEETTIAFIHPQLVSICALEGKREPTISDLLTICSNLAESGLLFAEKGRKDISRKISLNVSTDDIHYAINC